MKSKADVVRLLWRLLVVAVIVYVVAGIMLVFMSEVDAFDGGLSGFWSFLNDASGIAFRVGAGSLALMAGLWLSTRPWDEETPGPSPDA